MRPGVEPDQFFYDMVFVFLKKKTFNADLSLLLIMVCYRQLKGVGTFARDELSISLFQGFTNMLYIYRINS